MTRYDALGEYANRLLSDAAHVTADTFTEAVNNKTTQVPHSVESSADYEDSR